MQIIYQFPTRRVSFRLASSHPNSLPDIIKADANGNFSYGLPVCSNTLPMIITAYDSLNLTNSGPLSFNIHPGTQDIGNLNASPIISEHITCSTTTGGVTSYYQIVEPQAGINCSVYSTIGNPCFNLNIFSRVVGQNWTANLYSQGPIGVTGSHKLTRFRDRFDGINSYSWTTSLISTLTLTRYGAIPGDYIIGDAVVKYDAPHSNDTRVVHFHIKRDN